MMTHYIYTDHRLNKTLECDAEDILIADKLYEESGGRMDIKKGKKQIPFDVTTWSPDWEEP